MYSLRPPTTQREWDAFHSIREQVLWTARGRSDYDRNHADDVADGNYPMVLYLKDEPIGVVRIDVDESTAWLRRVAIREDMQRQGHGRRMLELALDFAVTQGCDKFRSSVDPLAIEFYRKLGFTEVRPAEDAAGVLMERIF